MIATSSTCTFALRDEYPEVLNVDNKGLRDHIELATRWLWRKLDEGKTLPLKPLPLKWFITLRAIWKKWAGRSTPWSCCVKSRGLS